MRLRAFACVRMRVCDQLLMWLSASRLSQYTARTGGSCVWCVCVRAHSHSHSYSRSSQRKRSENLEALTMAIEEDRMKVREQLDWGGDD